MRPERALTVRDVANGGRRIVCWFSCGAASAVATKLALANFTGQEILIVRTVIDSEHADNDRFAADCARWFNQSVINIRSEKYRDHWQVIEERRYISGHAGALCTTELKKIPRFAFQRPDDIQVFGYTVEEGPRIARFREANPEVDLRTPLVDAGLGKADCLAIIGRAGIELPAMYRLGFNNNNCIGCSKATGAGYWNRIRRHFPDAFARMARAQRAIGYTQVKLNGEPIYLDELSPDAGKHEEPEIDCSLLCYAAESVIA